MAKISANGCHELARYESPSGAQYLLRSDHRVLVKLVRGGGWTTYPTAVRNDAEFHVAMRSRNYRKV